MKPVKGYIGGCYRGYAVYPEEDNALTLDDASKKVLICSDPGLTEKEIELIKSWLEPDGHPESALVKLAKMAGVI